MISFLSYDERKVADDTTVLDPGSSSPYCDDVPCTIQIPMYFEHSRFASINNRQFVFSIFVRSEDFKQGMQYLSCMRELDIVIGRHTTHAIVSLAAMQAIYAIQHISPYVRDRSGAVLPNQEVPITFLDAHLGPIGVQMPSDRKEALLIVQNSCYVRLPHDTTFILSDDGTIVRSKHRTMRSGDHIYLVFRLVPLTAPEPHYQSFVTSRGPFAWTADPGTVYPDIICCDRLLTGGHRHIGLVETVEAPRYVRAKLTLSTYHDASIVTET